MTHDDPTSELGRGAEGAGAAAAGAPAADAAAEPAAPERAIGPYRLLRRVGEGGMGDVWLAEQTQPVRRTVALKLLRGGLYDSNLLQRFEVERQTLAMMNHPAIAKVFDAGATADGQPYFAMEYVDGQPITTFCDARRLGIEERLRLFAKVCDGVQHAHAKAIIHRDLKPSNVLVTEVDGEPAPRIIDFGIAKAIATGDAERALFTRVGAIIGTLGYMSPEQADPRAGDVDTRTDVYALGVILYELLTGSRPFETGDLPADEMLRRLREDDPPALATTAKSDTATATWAAARRGVDLKRLASLLKGDLDGIARKALARDRERRYGTPAELAADVRRYLANEPVEARRATAAYRVRKYVRRHRLGVALMALFLLTGFAVTAVQFVQLRRITRERDRADRIATFMTDIFTVVDPGEARGRTITAREVLDRAAGDLERGVDIDPAVRSQLTATMAETYTGLGLYSRALDLLAKATAGRTPENAAGDRVLLRLLALRGRVLAALERPKEGEPLLRAALAAQVAAFGDGDRDALETRSYLGDCLYDVGRYAEAEKEIREALRAIEAASGRESPRALRTRRSLVTALLLQDRLDEAEALGREVLATDERVLGSGHPSVVYSLNALGRVLQRRGRFPEAEKMFREALERGRRALGPEHDNTLTALTNLAGNLQQQGRSDEAIALAREAVDVTRRVSGEDAPPTLIAYETLAVALGSSGHGAEALELQRRVVEGKRRVYGDSVELQQALLNLAFTYSYAGQHAEAAPLYRESVRVAQTLESRVRLSDAWLGQAMGATMAGDEELAFASLRAALDAGPGFVLQLEQLDDLKPLRGDPRYAALVAEIARRKPR